MTQTTHVPCRYCHGLHPAEVIGWDEDAFPILGTVQACAVRLVAELAEDAGRALEIALSADNWPLAGEILDDALSTFDAEPDEW